MELGFVGLGRMGGNMVSRLVAGGHRVVGYDPASAARQAVEGQGARSAASLGELVAALTAPRRIWMMVPAGGPTESVIEELAPQLGRGDTLVDGGNSYYKDAPRRAQTLAARGVHYVDAGVSGGIWGREHGYCLMIGGPLAAIEALTPVFTTLAPSGSWLHVGAMGGVTT
jgi:6-phosphogluconate dehydrogenase